MKTEYEIAKENIATCETTKSGRSEGLIISHKATLQRFLGKLKSKLLPMKVEKTKVDMLSRVEEIPYPHTRTANLIFKELEKQEMILSIEIKDLEDALEEYEKNGI